jgi:hypothetical protein
MSILPGESRPNTA